MELKLDSGVYTIDCFRLARNHKMKTKKQIAEDLSWIIFQSNPSLIRVQLINYKNFPKERGKLIFLNLSHELECTNEFQTLIDVACDYNCRVVIFTNGTPNHSIQQRTTPIHLDGAKI